jgi:hypothetical protein
MGKGHVGTILFNCAVKILLPPMSARCKRLVPVPFLNGSQQQHSHAIQLMRHNPESTVKRCAESMERNGGRRGSKGVQIMTNFTKQALLRFAALAAAGTALSGCVYDVGLGYASDGYYDDYYCDPYGGYDSYYDCDYRSGFYNIGYGGGWYDSFWYPGHGYYLFDNYGRRHPMRDHHRRYWGEKRHHWYRENRGRHRDGNHRGRGRGYTDSATPGAIGWPERNGGRVRDGDDYRRGRGEGRRSRNDQWRGGDGRGADAVPTPNPEAVERPGRGRDRGDGYGRPNRRGSDGQRAVRVPRDAQPDMGQRRGRGDGRSFRQPPPPQAAPSPSAQSDVPAPRAAPPPRPERPARVPRQGRNDGERVREQ